jgi:hypothetical protein
MIQMTLSLLATRVTRPDIVQTPEIPVDTPAQTGSVWSQSDPIDVSQTAQDAGIPYKIAITGDLYDRLQRCHPGDPYENEVVLWDVLWLGEFEHTLNSLVPAFAFTATIPCANGETECVRLRYIAGDPVVIEMAD